MDLSKKFKMTSCHVIKIPSLEMDRAYPIVQAEKVQTKFSEAILLTTGIFARISKCFNPKVMEYSSPDLKSINEKTVSLALKYLGNCTSTKSYILEIE